MNYKKDFPLFITIGLTLLASILISLMVLKGDTVDTKPQSDSSKPKQETSTEETSQTTEAPPQDLIDYSVYNEELMAFNNIEKLDFSKYSDVGQVIESVIQDYSVYRDSVSVAYYNFINQEEYYINPDVYRVGASIVKVPYAGLMYDLVNNQYLTMDTPMPNYPNYYAEGLGNITNGPFEAYYPLSDVLYEMLVNSDNTATNIIYAYYENYIYDIESAIADFAGMADMPGDFYATNLLSSNFLLNTLIKLVENPDLYQGIIDTMSLEKEAQLFNSYVSQGMANKFGRMDAAINDCGVYYEDGQAQYALVVMTENVWNDEFLEVLNLRVNEWTRYQKTPAYQEETRTPTESDDSQEEESSQTQE